MRTNEEWDALYAALRAKIDAARAERRQPPFKPPPVYPTLPWSWNASDKRDLEGLLASAVKKVTKKATCRAHLRDRLGIPNWPIDNGLVGALRVRFEGPPNEQRWEPDEGAPKALIVAVRVNPETPLEIDSPDPRRTIVSGNLRDLIAYSPTAPSEWAFYTGLPLVLGAVEPQFIRPGPVVVHRTPHAWVIDEGFGVSLLTEDPREIQRIILEHMTGGVHTKGDEKFARDLRKIAATPRSIPPIKARWKAEEAT